MTPSSVTPVEKQELFGFQRTGFAGIEVSTNQTDSINGSKQT